MERIWEVRRGERGEVGSSRIFSLGDDDCS